MKNHGDWKARRLELSRMANGYQRSIPILTANHLGVFRTLGKGPLTLDELCEKLGTARRATELLLNALVGLDLLARDEDTYSLHGLADEFLREDAPFFLGDIFDHGWYLLGRWSRMEETLRTGKPIPRKEGGRSPEQLRAFILGMQNNGRVTAREIAESLDLRGVWTILDVGGGPGTYLYEFLKQAPGATGKVLDLPPVVEIAREQAEVEGLSDRVGFIPGSMFETDFEGPWDMILLSNIIHSHGVDKNRALVRRCSEALAPGGRLVIKDFFLDEDGCKPVDSALFSLNMLTATEDGRAYRRDEVLDWIREADLIHRSTIGAGTHSGVLVATRG